MDVFILKKHLAIFTRYPKDQYKYEKFEQNYKAFKLIHSRLNKIILFYL